MISFRRTLALAGPPVKWQSAVSKISPDLILSSNSQKFAAFYGDKILGAAVADWIMNQSDTIKSHSQASEFTARVLSNKFFAKRIDTILPFEFYQDAAKLVNEHSVGTMVEAAVAETMKEDKNAVKDLVEWLIEEAAADEEFFNAKGRLAELGGVVTATRIGGEDHSPQFQAIAALEGISEESIASTKKSAEQAAALLCLHRLGHSTTNGSIGHEIVPIENQLNQWNLFQLENNKEITLKDGETMLEWWLRVDRKAAFRRVLLSPQVFPDHIVSVDSWTRRSDDDAFILISILYRSSDNTVCAWSCTNVAKSASLARNAVGEDAMAFIKKMVSIE